MIHTTRKLFSFFDWTHILRNHGDNTAFSFLEAKSNMWHVLRPLSFVWDLCRHEIRGTMMTIKSPEIVVRNVCRYFIWYRRLTTGVERRRYIRPRVECLLLEGMLRPWYWQSRHSAVGMIVEDRLWRYAKATESLCVTRYCRGIRCSKRYWSTYI